MFLDKFLSFTPPYYGIATLLGILACSITLRFNMKQRKNIEFSYCILTALVGMVGAFFMAHIVYAVAQHEKLFYIISNPNALFKSIPAFIYYFSNVFGGMVFYGGLIGFCLGGYLYLKYEKLNIDNYTDVFAPLIPLFHAFGRIGCYLTGCCYGVELQSPLPFSECFTDNGIIHRLPIQLIEAFENLLLFIVLMLILYKFKNFKKGSLIFIYGITYSVLRFINEFFRGDYIERGSFGIMSTSQWISIFIFTFSLVIIIIKYIKQINKGRD
ncbi:MAG: prolipoprotein diacylglyceryl transferase family protein [Acutalibacteraceae bacterium]|nr:prolipoprotein diacylglyceryl transferase family protein [Acutalibacteraceae bacterium]